MPTVRLTTDETVAYLMVYKTNPERTEERVREELNELIQEQRRYPEDHPCICLLGGVEITYDAGQHFFWVRS